MRLGPLVNDLGLALLVVLAVSTAIGTDTLLAWGARISGFLRDHTSPAVSPHREPT
jgi:hypothetical protein